MQVLSNARRLSKVLKPPILLNSEADHKSLLSSFSHTQIVIAPHISHQWQSLNTFSSQSLHFSGIIQANYQSRTAKASFSTESNSVESTPTEAVKQLYDKILESVNVKRTMSPNAWLWSLIGNCKNHEDIKLLFDTLQNLRKFRLSNLRIPANFNENLCREVTKACVRVGAIDLGKKTLWKHNVYGISPTPGSAHHLLSYAKDHNDVKLLVEVMKLLKKNNIPLLPGTADIVFSICHNSGNWELISKYSKRFLKAGVGLRKTAFDIWMDFAAKRVAVEKGFQLELPLQLFRNGYSFPIGLVPFTFVTCIMRTLSCRDWDVSEAGKFDEEGDTESLWKIEKLRSESWEHLTIESAFSRAKGLILEHKPVDAAVIIKDFNEQLSTAQKSDLVVQLQKLVSEWPWDVVKHQPEENRKAVAASLKSDIPAMVTALPNMGLEVNVNLEDLASKEQIPS